MNCKNEVLCYSVLKKLSFLVAAINDTLTKSTVALWTGSIEVIRQHVLVSSCTSTPRVFPRHLLSI